MKLNHLESEILILVANEGPLSSTEIHQKISSSKVAYSTLSFALREMIIKKILTFEKVGNKYFYSSLSGINEIILGELEVLCRKYGCGLDEIAKIINKSAKQ